ncbi:uncharacterized protein C8Q71DRAFT_11812 [Rhodofomes roseus]|uniref:Manganese/iron superoxide dismutase C-terminal domain-containing protein n=1 Tax=Rhodofomes roseus TaxID=34475 RepID=A0A4Y9YD71_9APHY|nr:uncharacterized protein C8Q71DRAFT_11812 [Rhodofomes roseus]KAH9843730.1 hypothetical protein C8Q71DRAFT_11812 [Rhodofomes roseus]TFY59828.1 hypothetical protein EVJ58_g5537 [Rhodofomes roseus]
MLPLGLRLGATSSRGAARLVPACKHGRWVRSRKYHERKALPYPIENGLGKFLSPASLKVIASDYQNGLLDRLNDQVRGTVLENKSVVQTAIEAARDPHKVLEFDYACEALNNSFFLESLKPPADGALSNEDALGSQNTVFSAIKDQYGSMEQFQSNFSAAILGMFSSGWLYCVVDNVGEIAFYPIFGAGTLLIRSGEYQLRREKIVGEIIARGLRLGQTSPAPATGAETAESPIASSPVSGVSQNPLSTPPPPPHSRTFSTSGLARSSFSHGSISTDDVYAADNNLPPRGPTDTASRIRKVGETLYPLFCVSVHEHAWLPEYGVWGKEEYMKRFWTVLDWAKVVERYKMFTVNSKY